MMKYIYYYHPPDIYYICSSSTIILVKILFQSHLIYHKQIELKLMEH